MSIPAWVLWAVFGAIVVRGIVQLLRGNTSSDGTGGGWFAMGADGDADCGAGDGGGDGGD